jgi:hypothetical protein
MCPVAKPELEYGQTGLKAGCPAVGLVRP